MYEFPKNPQVAVIGLGYVGLPLAIALARFYQVYGFDINQTRVRELQEGLDRTKETTAQSLKHSSLSYYHDITELPSCDIYIVTVPTPVRDDKQPDLRLIERASQMVGTRLKEHDLIIYESTVYPGVTEDICAPLLCATSKLQRLQFYLGYAPERINPGDRAHDLSRITKVVAGEQDFVTDYMAAIYGRLTDNNIYKAPSIKVAEAAKVIENAQRDINIAFINEISLIMHKSGLSIYDVLDTARTKWNFLDFTPGLVGGHCIGVDPYYLAYCAQQHEHEPEIILSGRRTNEMMAQRLIHMLDAEISAHSVKKRAETHLLILGLTFKENIPDLRNTKVTELLAGLKALDYRLSIHDVCAHPDEARHLFDLELCQDMTQNAPFDGIVLCVAHDQYRLLPLGSLTALAKDNTLILDLKGIWRHHQAQLKHYWTL